jgi:hypothetical protein
MSQEIERAGWVWVDIRDPNKLDRTKVYKIEVGREYWNLRYGGLNEWFCFRKVGEPELLANNLIEAGCPVYTRREPLKWESTARVATIGGQVVLEELQGQVPDALKDGYVRVILIEAPDLGVRHEEEDRLTDRLMKW